MLAGSFLTIVASTLVSEDLACVAVGLLVAEGRLDAWLGVGGCAVGIFLGDVGLWGLGRAARRHLLAARFARSRIDASTLASLSRQLEGRAPWLILGSRFVPGSRVPLYVGSGVLGYALRPFATWIAIGVMAWVPLVVLGTGSIRTIAGGAGGPLGTVWTAAVAGLAACAALRLLRWLAGPHRRARALAAISRAWRWEFWPGWIFYAPVVAWVGVLSLRYGLRSLSAANPAFPDGGFVGESKHDILAQLPRAWTLRAAHVASGPLDDRVATLRCEMQRLSLAFPVIMKPDAGQRGVGVRRVASDDDARRYLGEVAAPVLVQEYHPGPFEAGIFYVRHPASRTGRIPSITDKRFPEVVGDGRSSLERLIWAHPRYRMQAGTFLARHAARRHEVLPPGERFPLGIVGNHAQGTLFQDGMHLHTDALARRIDGIARAVPGFFIGRFDVRYADVARFRAGEDLAIVELNGVTSEATHLYDPSHSLRQAYGVLFTQWRLVFQIGAANRRAGHAASPLARLVRCAAVHVFDATPVPVSD